MLLRTTALLRGTSESFGVWSFSEGRGFGMMHLPGCMSLRYWRSAGQPRLLILCHPPPLHRVQAEKPRIVPQPSSPRRAAAQSLPGRGAGDPQMARFPSESGSCAHSAFGAELFLVRPTAPGLWKPTDLRTPPHSGLDFASSLVFPPSLLSSHFPF